MVLQSNRTFPSDWSHLGTILQPPSNLPQPFPASHCHYSALRLTLFDAHRWKNTQDLSFMMPYHWQQMTEVEDIG